MEDGGWKSGKWEKKRLAVNRISRNEIIYNRILELFVATIYHCKILTLLEGARCWWHSWLRHCAKTWKFSGSIPDVFTGIFH